MIALSFHTIAGSATQRFLSVAVGESEVNGNGVLCGWRKIVTRVHVIVALLTTAVSIPVMIVYLGDVAGVSHEMASECRMVILALLVQGFAMMVNTPNRQLFIANQSMVEPAIWGTVGVVVNFSLLCWMAYNPGAWLVKYAFLMMVANVAIEVCMGVRARCLFSSAFKRDPERAGETSGMITKLVKFTGWRMISDGGGILSVHGFNILVNRLLGASFTGGVGIARSMTNHANSLACSIGVAFEPAMANDAGRNSGVEKKLVYKACICQTGAYLFFAVPIWLFIDEILGLWLGTPPPGCATAVRWLLASAVMGAFGCSFFNAVSATGKVKKLYIGVGIGQLAALPLGFVLSKMDVGLTGLSGLCCGFFLSQMFVAIWDWYCFNEICGTLRSCVSFGGVDMTEGEHEMV